VSDTIASWRVKETPQLKQFTKEKTVKNVLGRVPAVTAVFWLVKVLATTVGETAADFLSVNLNLGLAGTSYVMSGILLLLLLHQFRLKRYVPVSY
jgi:uncharacterized membrane-anchored protein